MSDTTTFPIRKVNALRLWGVRASRVSMEGPDGWTQSDVDLMRLVRIYDSLRVKEGYTLRAYQFRTAGDGTAVVWAMPIEAEFPEPDAANWEDCESNALDWLKECPRPPMALDGCMEAIEGDGTPWSYLCASLLGRELAEFGALWHGGWWSSHAIAGEDPFEASRLGKLKMRPNPFTLDEWEWQGERPVDWSPCVRDSGSTVTVQFYTFSGLGTNSIYMHTDLYRAGNYAAESNAVTIAAGQGGFLY
jgi:hypothetical protein